MADSFQCLLAENEQLRQWYIFTSTLFKMDTLDIEDLKKAYLQHVLRQRAAGLPHVKLSRLVEIVYAKTEEVKFPVCAKPKAFVFEVDDIEIPIFTKMARQALMEFRK